MERPFVTWLNANAFAPMRVPRLTLPRVTLLLLAALFAVRFATSDTYQSNGGVGDDGIYYLLWIQRYAGDVRALGFNAYVAQRSVGVLVVRVLLDLLHMPADIPHVVRAFQAIDLACMVGSVAAWTYSARHFQLTRAGFLVATTFSYASFAALRWLPWDPVLTDAQGALLGAVALALYLARQPLVLAVVSVVGAFMWPSFGFIGAALLLFPRPPPRAAETSADVTEPRALTDGVAAIVAAAIAYGASTLIDYAPPNAVPRATRSLFGVSCALVAVVAFLGLRPVLPFRAVLRDLRRWDVRATLSRALAPLVLVAVALGVRYVTSNPRAIPVAQTTEVSNDIFLRLTLFLSVQRPLAFLVAHAAFFGVGALAVTVGWYDVCREARRLGLGIVALLGLTLLLALNSESRRMFPLASIVLPMGVFAFRRTTLTVRRLVVLGAIALVASKFWYRIVQTPALDAKTLFAHIGPWMPDDALVVQGIACAGIAVWMYRARRPTPDGVQLFVG